MIHNAWAIAIGNRHDMADAAERLEPFDAAMAQVYSSRTGMSLAQVGTLMDKETWINSSQAVEDGFATGTLERSAVSKDAKAHVDRKALALIEASMARAGHSRTARRDAFKALFSGKPGAAGDPAMPSAGNDTAALLHSLTATLKG